MPPLTTPTGLTITNPLVLYRTLLATRRIEPDPAQHRLALHLQKLYFRLKDYEPEIDFSYRLQQLNSLTRKQNHKGDQEVAEDEARERAHRWSIFGSTTQQKQQSEALALTKRLTDHEAAIQIDSPQGLLLYGEVGTGKSLLVDLLADSLPTQKKRRWHFNTFMLETFAKLETLRKNRLSMGMVTVPESSQNEEHSLLWLARDMISTSPILFLDEFQLPDRAASKILSNLLTSFFHLGGVLIATSNRMPEELANAAGVEFSPPPASRIGLLRQRWGLSKGASDGGTTGGLVSGQRDFAAFLEVLKARCETWDIEGGRDWRRREAVTESEELPGDEFQIAPGESFGGLEPLVAGNIGLGYEQSTHTQDCKTDEESTKAVRPKWYFVSPNTDKIVDTLIDQWKAAEILSLASVPNEVLQSANRNIPWQSATAYVYGRKVPIPRQLAGVTKWTFNELCAANFGPADFITFASTFHTFILTDVPVLTFLQKNEARRFITLLDALYEARCKLLISAEAGPDDIFFPENKLATSDHSPNEGHSIDTADGVYSETFAEIYQDASAPFRPNVSQYAASLASASTPDYAPTTASPFTSTRSILADEDSDFGPTYGAGRGRGVSDGDPGAGHEIGRHKAQPDFSKIGAYTGEDERFAYKRAQSRLWEMCGSRWWARQEEGWWRPLSKDARRWEDSVNSRVTKPNESEMDDANKVQDNTLFRHGASPFRTSPEPPPKFSFVHAWGMMKWGKKAGSWGQGTDGLTEREAEKAKKRGND